MDELYKILLAAAVGFFLSPITEMLKIRISSKQHKSTLITKLKTFDSILCKSIPTLVTTINDREDFINNQTTSSEKIFITPNFNFPKIESNIENAYLALSDIQRNALPAIESQATYIKELIAKLLLIENERKTTLHKKVNIDKEATKEQDIREIDKEHYKRIVSCEKAILYTSACMLATVRRSIKNDSIQPKDADAIKQASIEFGLEIDMNWWPNLRNNK